jgi:ABC-type Fe3+-hydroxamate transport system substrate-binding protein
VALVTDDLGTVVDIAKPATRVVSLVPSLTESIAATRPDALVAVTQWCTHPAELAVERIRGTKNPDVRRIIELRPDLVVANQEENRHKDVALLRAAGVPVWVTVTETVPGAIAALQRMFTAALGWPEPDWLTTCHAIWDALVPPARLRVAIPIWRDPWMAVGRDTFGGDLAARLGLANAFANSAERYPHVTVEEIIAAAPDLILLPDEPYRFTLEDGPEAFPGLPCALVQGRALTWYGPSLLSARDMLLSAITDRR